MKPIVKKPKPLYMVLVYVGIILIGLSALSRRLDVSADWLTRILGFCSGLGTAISAGGAIGLIVLYKKPESARQQGIAQNDERNIKIRESSAYGTFFITFFSMLAAEVVFTALDNTTGTLVVIVMMAVHITSMFALMHRNNKRF